MLGKLDVKKRDIVIETKYYANAVSRTPYYALPNTNGAFSQTRDASKNWPADDPRSGIRKHDPEVRTDL